MFFRFINMTLIIALVNSTHIKSKIKGTLETTNQLSFLDAYGSKCNIGENHCRDNGFLCM